MSEQRLDRIEDKLDKLTDLVGSVIRIEEKQAAVTDRLDTHEKRLNRQSEKQDDQEARLTKVEGRTGDNTWFVRITNGAILTGVISLAFFFLRE